MEAKSEPSNNEVTQEKLNNLKDKSNIIFLTNAKKITFMNKNDNEYISFFQNTTKIDTLKKFI